MLCTVFNFDGIVENHGLINFMTKWIEIGLLIHDYEFREFR